jgi:hypothetical protein
VENLYNMSDSMITIDVNWRQGCKRAQLEDLDQNEETTK